MKQVFLDRLKLACDIMKVIPEKDYNQCSFGKNCSTVGCVAYHYIRIARPDGLVLAPHREFAGQLLPSSPKYDATMSSDNAWMALSEHFGLSRRDVKYIFEAHSGWKPKDAVRLLSKFIRSKTRK